MALDGIFLHKLTGELKTVEGMHIDKIYQPSNDELVLLLRRPGKSVRLLISANPAHARVHFTESRPENPERPPMFCMLLRKHLSSARILSVEQIGLERIIIFKTVATNEMGDAVYPELIVELMGAASNIILKMDGLVLDAVHRSNIEGNSRIIHAGAVYSYPPRPDKINILESGAAAVYERTLTLQKEKLDKALLLAAEGFSPLICREIAGEDILVSQLTGYHKNILFERLEKIEKEIISGGAPTIIKKSDGTAFEFSFCEINQYGSDTKNERYDNYSTLLEGFYTARANRQRIVKQSQDLLKMLTVLSSRASKRMEMRKLDLKKCENREELRVFGELLKANLHTIKQGQTVARVQNYYDENLGIISIPLNPALSPQQNAAKYFKDYKKSYTAEQTLKKLIEEDAREIEYFDTVLDALSRAATLSEIAEIREELANEGYIKRPVIAKKTAAKHSFMEEVSPSGYRVLYGKNNRMNEELTLKTAAKNDMWFHIKNMAGSHVVVLCGGAQLTEADMEFAARIAAKNSKGAALTSAPVDYTQIKNVKKIPGGKTGMVTYTSFKTYFVKTNEAE